MGIEDPGNIDPWELGKCRTPFEIWDLGNIGLWDIRTLRSWDQGNIEHWEHKTLDGT